MADRDKLEQWRRREHELLQRGIRRSQDPNLASGTVPSKTAGHVNTQWPELPTERHRQLLVLLRSRSHRDAAGRLVSWWPQAKLAAELDVSVRTLQNVLADLREPTSDPRHPTAKPPGLRLGLIRVEPTTYRDSSTRQHRLGGNLYVLIDPRQHATPDEAVSAGRVNTQAEPVACLNKGDLSTPPVGGTTPAPGDGEQALRVDTGGALGLAAAPALEDNWIRVEPPEAMLLEREPDWVKVRRTIERAFGDDVQTKLYRHGKRAAKPEAGQ
jgi:hypothetical protein